MRWYDKILLAFILVSVPLLTVVYAAKWSDYTDATSGTIADADTFLFLDTSDTTLAATGTQKELSWANLKTDLNSAGFGKVGTAETITANWVNTANPWAVNEGGTGAATLTDGGVLLGSGTAAVTAMAVLADGEVIVGDGTTDPVAESGATLRTSIGVGTGDTPQFTGVEVGHATDSTLTRSAAGILAVEGNQIPYNTGTTVVTGLVELTTDTAATVDLSGSAGANGEWRVNNDADAIQYTLPPGSAGLTVCFLDNAGGVISIDPDDETDVIVLDGTALTAGNELDSPGSRGDFACLLAVDGDTWIVLGKSGTWVDGGAS